MTLSVGRNTVSGGSEIKWVLLQCFWLNAHHQPDVPLHLVPHVLVTDVIDIFHLCLYKAVMNIMRYAQCLSLETPVCSLLILPLP